MNLFDYLIRNARSFPNNLAIASGTSKFANWSELRQRAGALGAALALPAGSRVAIISSNRPEYLEILFGCWAAGLVVVPINAKLHPREIGELFQCCHPAAVFVSSDIQSDPDWKAIEIGSSAYKKLLKHKPLDQIIDCDPDDPAWIFFTSGTTGRSKGATLTIRNLKAMVVAHLADFETLDQTHRLLHAAPMSHGSGLYILPYVAHAAAQIIPQTTSFDPVNVLELCEFHKGVGMFLAPTMLRRLRMEAEPLAVFPEGLRSIIYGGAPMYLAEIKKCQKTFGNILSQLYGQGEAPMTITGMTRKDHEEANDNLLQSVGWPRLGVEVQIWDEEDKPLPGGATGEIVCRGDVVMSGYWEDEEATANTLRDGWLKTGDIGFLSDEGFLTLQDRSKDVIISGGSNIYPREVEEVLLRAEGVTEVCVFGIPDKLWGEIVTAVVVPDGNVELDQDKLDYICLDTIARFKRPKIYHFWDELPKSAYGKVLKRVIRNRVVSNT